MTLAVCLVAQFYFREIAVEFFRAFGIAKTFKVFGLFMYFLRGPLKTGLKRENG